jgi:hypothetical protein
MACSRLIRYRGDHGFIESQSWFRTVPIDEFPDGLIVRSQELREVKLLRSADFDCSRSAAFVDTNAKIDRKRSWTFPSPGADAEALAAATRGAGFRHRWPTPHINLRRVRADWRESLSPRHWKGKPDSRHSDIGVGNSP